MFSFDMHNTSTLLITERGEGEGGGRRRGGGGGREMFNFDKQNTST